MTNTLPRPELREAAFRRFEADIAAAVGGNHTVSPKAMNARTYIARFRDAVLAYRLLTMGDGYMP